MPTDTTTPRDDYHATITRLTGTDLEALSLRWRELEARCDCSFFQSWSWMGSWLALALRHVELYLFECRRSNEIVALATLSRSTIRRRHLFRVTQLTLNDAPLNSGVGMNIEYNDLLALSDDRTEAWSQLLDAVNTNLRGWDELVINSLPASTLTQLPKPLPHRLRLSIEETLTPWVTALDEHTESIDTFLKGLSKNRRWQIRRSLKEYERDGEITVSCADTTKQALEWFDRLGELHTARWNRVGKPGSFAFPKWVEFHRQLIAHCFERGEIQLLRVHCQERDIGYIYSFSWRGRVYMLQTGLASESSNLLRPGYISHLQAIVWNRRTGNSHYDFMWGDAEYKTVLATPSPQLHHLRIQRKRIKLAVENSLLSLYRVPRKITR